MSLRITTWNVNSIRRRLDGLARLVQDVAPDVICVQETKVTDEAFPHGAVEDLGYPHILAHGMKGYNGVAILSRLPLAGAATRSWCGKDDCRHAYATLAADGMEPVELHNLYIPAGGDVPNPATNPKFAHKLDFLTALAGWWGVRRGARPRMVAVGDFNVAPLETDVWSHQRLKGVVTHTPIEIEHLTRAMEAGAWIDAVRHFVPPSAPLYSWWSYRMPDWRNADKGRRLDHIWVTPALESELTDASVLRRARGWQPPSDHVPVTVTLAR
ncbi:MAG: exodeoxyribonuclease III [Rhodospirillales bacterium]|jgi:exodeoxyribonuclease-3|nr:exodeoxyribonuclease III [Rhodospirillales bacterium]MDP6882518.1 exodeoxyribonuclease III [Rhodospirillales bacterium]